MLSSVRKALLKNKGLVSLRTVAAQRIVTAEPKTPLARYRSYSVTTVTATESVAATAVRQKVQPNTLNRASCVSLIQEAKVTTEKEIANAATIAKWFYYPSRQLEKTILHDVNVWKEVLKLGFSLAGKGHRNDLFMLVSKFTKLFPVESLADQEAVGLLIKAYGIMGRPQSVSAVLEGAHQTLDRRELEVTAILAYADCGAHAKVNALLQSNKDNLDPDVYRKLARVYAYKGNVKRTKAAMGNYENSEEDKETLLRAHGRALDAIYRYRVKHRGVFGMSLDTSNTKTTTTTTRAASSSSSFDTLDQSFSELMDSLTLSNDVHRWNLVLDYYCRANRLDPTRYPMARAEALLKDMTTQGLEPNEKTYFTLFNAYSHCQEYDDKNNNNTRLDKALGLFEDFPSTDTTDYRRVFQALLRACTPHGAGQYPYDYFVQGSNIESGTPRMHLDPRFFDIEKIMFNGRVPYDRLSLATALTCLGAARQYKAMWKRWQMVKLSGLRRNQSLFRHVFALASLDPEQAKYALSVVKEELVREVPNVHEYHPDLLTAMLDCCVTAKEPRVAKQIIHGSSMLSNAQKNKEDYHRSILAVLRATTSLQGLEVEAKAAFEAIPKEDISHNNRIWYWSMVYLALQGGNASQAHDIQDLFTRYTMKRFESLGKVPVPVRESSPVVPFPSGPYTSLDTSMIDMYIQSLVDSQDASLVVDVLKEWNAQKNEKQHLSKTAQQGVRRLLEQEQSGESLDWVKQNNI